MRKNTFAPADLGGNYGEILLRRFNQRWRSGLRVDIRLLRRKHPLAIHHHGLRLSVPQLSGNDTAVAAFSFLVQEAVRVRLFPDR